MRPSPKTAFPPASELTAKLERQNARLREAMNEKDKALKWIRQHLHYGFGEDYEQAKQMVDAALAATEKRP